VGEDDGEGEEGRGESRRDQEEGVSRRVGKACPRESGERGTRRAHRLTGGVYHRRIFGYHARRRFR
jgi:hypothetical protein